MAANMAKALPNTMASASTRVSNTSHRARFVRRSEFEGKTCPAVVSKTSVHKRAGSLQAVCSSEAFSNSRRDLLLSSAGVAAASQIALPQGAFADEVFSSQWEKVDLPVEEGVILLDIAFVPDDPLHGFLLGTRQTVLETKDGGKTWENFYLGSLEEEGLNYRFNSISFNGNEGFIIGKPAILYHTTDGGANWERVPLSARLPGDPQLITATDGKGGAEMITNQGAIYATGNAARTWKAAVEETVDATLNRTVSSGISGASYYTGSFATVNRADDGSYVGVSTRGNFYMTWEPGQTFWQPHNRASSRRIQNMGWRNDGGLWLIARGGELFFGEGDTVTEDFEQQRIGARGFGILDVGFRTDNEVWASGGSGSLLKSVDGGKKWKREKGLDGLAGNLYTVKFADKDTGFVLGNDGILLRYISGSSA